MSGLTLPSVSTEPGFLLRTLVGVCLRQVVFLIKHLCHDSISSLEENLMTLYLVGVHWLVSFLATKDLYQHRSAKGSVMLDLMSCRLKTALLTTKVRFN